MLIATVALADANFHHTVVLICQHEDSAGTYGLVLNRPLTVPLGVRDEYPFLERHLYRGGPVQEEVLQVLHPYGGQVSGALEVLPGVWLGGDFEELRAGLTSGLLDVDACRFFLGYSGWDDGQLAVEFELNSWLKSRGNAELVFGTDSEVAWSRAIRQMAGDNPLYANFPANPIWN